jgi:hypothetical protein
MDIMMRKIAFGLAALTIATAGSTLTALALPGGSLGVAQSVGHADNNNIDKVTLRRTRAFHYGITVPPLRRAFGFHPILGRRKTVTHHY